MKWKQSVALILAASCVVMTGCRESEVIQNVVLTTDASEVDDTEILSSQEQERIDEMAQYLADKQDEEARSNSGDNGTVEKSEGDASDSDSGYLTGADGENQDSQGGGSSANGGNGDSVQGPESDDKTDQEEKKDEPEEEPEEELDEDQEETPDPEDENNTGSNSAGRLENNPNARQIYDESGNIVTLPEFVGSVAAPSEAALIVQMLGGKGMLAASSADFLTNDLAKEVFADEGISDVVQLWDKEGKLSDSNFRKLLEMHPDCVVVPNGNYLSADHETQLKAADIPVVKIPVLNSAKSIENAVLIVGKALGDNTSEGGLNSLKLAQDYVSYEQALVKSVSSENGICSYVGYDYYYWNDPNTKLSSTLGTYNSNGKCTLYIDEWDDDAYLYKKDVVDQNGIAVVNKDYQYHAMTWYLSVGGVIDSISQFGNNVSNCCMYLNPTTLTASSAGTTTNISGTIIYRGETNNYNGWVGGLFGVSYSTSTFPGTSIVPSSFVGFLGEKSFQAVLVKSEEIKTKLEASRDSATGLYRPALWNGPMRGSNGEYRWFLTDNDIGNVGYGGLVNVTVSDIPTMIHEDYEVYVNPCGVGSWTDGSVESFLESYWASSKFYKSYSEDAVNNKIQEFYKKFYRHELTSDQLNDILDGI